MIICPSCKGKKTTVSLGNLIKDCPKCHGVGWIQEEMKVTLKDVMESQKPKKKKTQEPILQC